MCGVSGLFGRHWNQKQFEAMITAQRHRGPEAEGVYLDPSKIAGLGHNRLSIIDLSPAGRQPISNRDGSLRIVFNGEIYNYLDSATLLAMIKTIQGEARETRAFTFTCGDSRYDETPWVRQMLARTRHPLTVCRIAPEEVPSLAESVQAAEDEPFGGLPTLAYAKLFADVRQHGVIVLLDGQGMDERASMLASTELREPFLDHRLFELALRQPPERKISGGIGKWMLRQIAGRMAPEGVVEAPKRPLQTPQREWLRGPLSLWTEDRIEAALERFGGLWLKSDAVRSAWKSYCRGESDNSFYVWQWINLDLATSPR
ncbi:MAG: asparagine synthase C-terminal domain-containing protein [Acidobacteria bacterium]|nr:asparagine synthase C-terminal domain-containing protein [Acidobacteriota bacterium]